METSPFTPTASPSTNSPWFGISMGLLGLIIGYGIASYGSLPSAPRVAVPPSPASPPSPPSLPSPPSPPTPPSPPRAPTVSRNASELADDDPAIGDLSAPLTIIEWSDFQCPFCKRFRDQTFDQLKAQYVDTGKVRFVYRDFPLDSIHPQARPAAIAGECVKEQDSGKFWPFHDKIFANQQAWSNNPGANDLFKQYATELGLDISDCVDSRKFDAEVSKDLSDGSANGISGTPGFIVGNQLLSGAQPFASFQAAIDAQLGSAGPSAAVPSVVPTAQASDVRTIDIASSNWQFSPATITAKRGEKVQLRITGVSGTHGFGVPELGINVPVAPGETKIVDLPTDKSGTFVSLCTIPCGAGHADMRGQIVIE